MDDYLEKLGDTQFAVVFRPLTEKTDAAVQTACVGMIIAAEAIARTGLGTPEIDARTNEIWTSYVTLTGGQNTWA